MGKTVITGFGQISNLGHDADEAFKKLKLGDNSSLLKLPMGHLDQDLFPHSPLDVPLEALNLPSHLTRTNQLTIKACLEALDRAGLTADEIKDKKVGVCLGTTSGCSNSKPELSKDYFLDQTYDFVNFEEAFTNNPVSALARHLNLNGPLLTINNACTGGADAIGIGRSWIEQEQCDFAIVGGTETILENMYFGFRSLGLISSDHPKPFCLDREGLVLGEGAGILILESISSAQMRKAKAYAEVLGYSGVTDAYHPTSPPPDAKGLKRSVKEALAQAQITETDIQAINAHATGTQTNDDIEGRFLKSHFPNTPIFATKPYTGHCLGASGAVEAIWGIFCFENQTVPASLGQTSVDPEIGIELMKEATKTPVDYFLSTSLGFGGLNAALVLGRVK